MNLFIKEKAKNKPKNQIKKNFFSFLFDRERSQIGRETGREKGSRLSAEQRAQCGA